MKPKYLWLWTPAVALMLWDVHAGLFTNAAPARASSVSATSQYPVGVLPDPKLTPGATLPGITAQQTCTGAYARGARNVPNSEKDTVWNAYRTAHPEWKLPVKRDGKIWEIDHRCPLTVGGQNCESQLWPEQWHINYNGLDIGAKTKDSLELKDHHLVCEGKITLQQAQADFLSTPDWTIAYRQRVGPLPRYVASLRPAK